MCRAADPPTLDDVIAAIFDGGHVPTGDVNADGVDSAADVTARVRESSVRTPTATPSPTVEDSPPPTTTPSSTATESPPFPPSPTPTREPTTPAATASPSPPLTPSPTLFTSPTSTTTMTPTPSPPCPTTGAEVGLRIDDFRVSPVSELRLRAHLVVATCGNSGGLRESLLVDGVKNGTAVGSLVPGRWVFTLDADGSPQQHRPALVVAGAGRNPVRLTAFAAVRTVTGVADTAEDGSLRSVLAGAAEAPKPLLIRFSDDVFPAGAETVIRLGGALPVLGSSYVTVDGTDADGASGLRVVDAAGLAIPALSVTGAANSIVGLRLRNSGENNRDVLSISGPGAQRNTVERCVVDSAASADAIGIDNGAGIDLEVTANVVRDCEVFNASDKGIKVTTGAHVRVENCWVRDNDNGGIQATLGGHLWARNNLVERSGGASAQNGIAVNGADSDAATGPSELLSEGNIVRFNAANGISVRGQSVALIRNDYLAANGSSGLRVFDQGITPPALAVVEGTTAACNGFNGAAVADSSTADFGGGPFGSPGNNAFTQTNDSDANLRNSTATTVFALNNQWEHCGSGTTCDEAQIAAHDLSDHGAFTLFSPPQVHRDQQPPMVTGVRPAKAMAGEIVRIFGSGFNAIDAHATGEPCPDLGARNRCVPVRGNCVRIGDVPAALEAVTPTMLAVRMPFSCVVPVTLTVQTQGGGTSSPVALCTNDDP